MQADGKIVAAGYSWNGSNYDFALVRYHADGSLDSSFHGDGKLTTSFGGSDDVATEMAIQADGKLVVVGYTNIGGYYDFAVARYNSDGSLDTTFDGDGKLTTSVGPEYDVAESAVIQPDGKIVAAGHSSIGTNNDFALVRYTPDGTLDTSFDADGKLTTPIGIAKDIAYSVALQADGKLVAAGYCSNGTNNDFAVVRYNSDGSLDDTFDFDGKFTTSVGPADDVVNSAAIRADGKIVVAGYSSTGTSQQFAIALLLGDNHAPVATSTTFHGTEDTVLRIDTPSYFSDPEGDRLAISLLTGPVHGALEVTPYGTFTYTPDPQFVGMDSFSYKVADPDGAFDVGTVAIHVADDAADRLEVVTSPGIVTFTESVPPPSSPRVIDSGLRVGTALEDPVRAATVKIIAGYVPKKDVLTFTTLGKIRGKFNAKTGTLTLTGAATAGQYEAALRTVKYANNSAQPVDGLRTVAFQLRDGAGLGEPATRLVRVVGVNTKPVLTLTGPSLNYKRGAKPLAVAGPLKLADLDNTRLQEATITITSGFAANFDKLTVKTRDGIAADYNATTGVLKLTGTTLRDYLAVLKSLKFETPSAAAAGARTISFSVNDGIAESDAVTRSVTVQ